MRVLVPVDGSKASMQAVNVALEFARAKGASVCMLSIVPPMADFDHELSASQRDSVIDSLTRRAKEVMKQATDVAHSKGVIPVCEIRAESNSVADEICEYASDQNIDLIVIGRKGLKRIERALMGSVTTRVIGCSPANVLVVPSDAVLSWKKILLTTDGSRCSDAAVSSALQIARAYNSEELKVLSVVDVPDEAYAEAPNAIDKLINRAQGIVESVRKQADELDARTYTLVKEGEAYTVITDVAKQFNANLICMGSHGRTGLSRFVMGSVTERVIGLSACPVLIAKQC